MGDIQIGVIRRTRFLHPVEFINTPADTRRNAETMPWDVKEEFKTIVESFMRNRILIGFTTSNMTTQREYDHSEYQQLVDGIHDYCDEFCTGYWTLQKTYYRGVNWNHSTGVATPESSGSGKITVFFEKEEDIPGFLKDCAILLKLAN